MKATRTLAALVAASALLGGCASQSSQPYYANNGYNNGYDNTASTGYGTIESIQVTSGEGRTSGAGAIVGGLVGALAGNGGGRTAATVAGGVAGAAIGNRVEANREGAGQQQYAVNIRLDNGEYRTIVQDNVYDLRVGNRVRIVDGRVYRY